MMGNEKGEVDDTAVMPLESWGEKSVVTSDEFYNGEERAAYTKQYEMYGATGVPTAADVDEEIEALEVYDGDAVSYTHLHNTLHGKYRSGVQIHPPSHSYTGNQILSPHY